MVLPVMLLALSSAGLGLGPEVTTSGGKVFGTALPASAGSQPVNQFLGMPFASAGKWEAPRDMRTKYATDPLNATMWGDQITAATPFVVFAKGTICTCTISSPTVGPEAIRRQAT